ncbi:MAG: phosphatidylserine decarboxylase family protein, partial [Candidatus Aenigmarchaeota archaeon]|nr:phosphatidylserine decarboxylase family protein [Candidatus Aenigmarchaeota archaeon]
MIERGGLKIFILLLATSAIFFFIFLPIALILLFFAIFTAYFFRDPERKIEDGVIAPADGKIDYI